MNEGVIIISLFLASVESTRRVEVNFCHDLGGGGGGGGGGGRERGRGVVTWV